MTTIVDVTGLRKCSRVILPNQFDPQEEGSDFIQSVGVSTCWNMRVRNPEEQSLNINSSDIASATAAV